MDDDIPWDRFDTSLLSEEQEQTVKMNAITEWAALPATEMFLRDNRDDSILRCFDRPRVTNRVSWLIQNVSQQLDRLAGLNWL
jgi:hypothetical protein